MSLEKSKMPTIIGITGLAGAGKDTISNMVMLSLRNELKIKTQAFAFADTLKKAASIIFNVPLEHFYDRDVKEAKIPYWDMSPREMAQKLGTDACRRGIRDDIWIKSLESTVISSGVDVAFITDVRFDNEAEFVHQLNPSASAVVRIVRSDQTLIATSDHESERGVSPKFVNLNITNITGNPFVAAAELQNWVIKTHGVNNE